MQSGGEIYSMFDPQLTSKAYNVTDNSKGKLWIPSRFELTGMKYDYDGNRVNETQFALWKTKGVTGYYGESDPLKVVGTRSGGNV